MIIYKREVSYSVTKSGDNNLDIWVMDHPTKLGRLLGFKERENVFRGSGTVWHNLDTGKRQGTLKEGWLAEIAWKYNNRKN
jgi:hypothetical protein